MKKFVSLLIIAFITLKVQAQKEIKNLPEDLDKAKIIFLELTVRPAMEKPKGGGMVNNMMYKQSVGLAKFIPMANDQLKTESKNYPFGYEIVNRSKLDEYKAKGFKYALDCQFYQLLDMGAAYGSAPHSVAYTDLYLIDLETKDKYIFDEIKSSEQLRYGPVVKRFIKKVKKKYNVD